MSSTAFLLKTLLIIQIKNDIIIFLRGVSFVKYSRCNNHAHCANKKTQLKEKMFLFNDRRIR